MKKPNVLVLMCDQMQAQRLGCVDEKAYTPHLDTLRNEGVHFTNAYTAQGQCVPARAVFMTGKYAHECGVMINYGTGFFNHQGRLSRKHTTLAQHFKTGGYRTAYFGKCHFGVPLSELGFDVAHDYDGVKVSDEDAGARGFGYVPGALRGQYQAAQDAEAFLKNYQPDDTPLFFMFSTNLPHPPFFADENYRERFKDEEMLLPESFLKEMWEGKPPFQKAHAEDGHHGSTDPVEGKKMLADYYSMIAAMDDHYGKIIAQFKRLGLWDNTVVLFFADHGDMMNAHKLNKKGTIPYDELYKIPCLMKLPAGMQAARNTVDDLVSSVDLPGSLLKAAGLAVPADMHGADVYDACLRGSAPDDAKVFFEHYGAYWGLHPLRGVRQGPLKYVKYYGDDNTEEMYDLSKAPHELSNVAADPAYADKRNELADAVDRWWQSTGGRDAAFYETEEFKTNRYNTQGPDGPDQYAYGQYAE